MSARRRYWKTEPKPSILWRSSSRGTRRQDEISSDESTSPLRDYCTVDQQLLKQGGFMFAPQSDRSASAFVTPDNASTPTSEDTTTPYEIMDDDLLSEGIQRKNKVMFHMKHLQHEFSRWMTTVHKHKKIKRNNNHRQRTIKRSPTTRRKSTTPSRSPIRRKRAPQIQTNICPFDGLWLTNDNGVVGIDNGKCSTFNVFQTNPATRTCSGTIRGYLERYKGELTKDLRSILWNHCED